MELGKVIYEASAAEAGEAAPEADAAGSDDSDVIDADFEVKDSE